MIVGTFYNELLRKYTVLFGNMFNDITITKDSNTKQEKVPISYGPREKFLARVSGDADIERNVGITLPRISFEITSMNFSPERKLNTMNKMVSSANTSGVNTYRKIWQPVPYDIIFQLNIISKSTEDGAKIIEQILPFFTPDWTISVKLFDNMDDIIFDIPIILNSVSNEDTYEGDFSTRRALIWTLDFTMKAFFYGPEKEAKVIKITKTNLYTGMNVNTEYEEITIKPGLTSDGNPTTYEVSDLVQAYGTVVISGNTVSEIIMANTGFGYEEATMTITPSGGITARANAIIKDGMVIGAEITEPGTLYSTANVTISAPDEGSVSYVNIDEDDNYGFITKITTKE